MRIFSAVLGLMLAMMGAVASDVALAGRGHSGHFGHSGGAVRSGQHGHRAHGRVFLAAPVIAPLYFPPLGYYAAPLPATPPVYIEQDPVPPKPEQPYYWYYCADSKTYYPYVDDCAGGWQQVVPETPPPS